MSRFLARARALVKAPPDPPPLPNIGDCGGIGDRGENQNEKAGTPLPPPSGRQRMTAWADPSRVPEPGDWCSCCGRFDRAGGRWWREVEAPTGWRCMTCCPPSHLPADRRVEVVT